MTADCSKTCVRVNAYRVVSDAVDRGVEIGYNRAHKHTDSPTEGQLVTAIQEAVMSELSDYLWFPQESEVE